MEKFLVRKRPQLEPPSPQKWNKKKNNHGQVLHK